MARDSDVGSAIELMQADPLAAGIVLLTVGGFLLLQRSGISFRFRKVRFPWTFVIGFGCSAAALILAPTVGRDLDPDGPLKTLRDGFVPAMMSLNGIVAAIYFGLPAIHALSGYRPAIVRLRIAGIGPDRERTEVLDALRAHMQARGLQIQDPQKWGADLAAQGRFAGTVNAGIQIPVIVRVDARPSHEGLDVDVRCEQMDICIKDTGESANSLRVAESVASGLLHHETYGAAAQQILSGQDRPGRA